LKKNISDGVESRNGSNGTPLNPPLFWLDNIFNLFFKINAETYNICNMSSTKVRLQSGILYNV
jgi:hypothetical protein